MSRRKKISNVVGLHGPALPPHGVPDQTIVDILQQLLDKAKAGAISGFAYVTVEQANITNSEWFGEHAKGQAMITGVTELFFHMIATDLGFIRRMPESDSGV